MEFKVIFLLAIVALALAEEAKEKATDDLKAEEGRRQYTHAKRLEHPGPPPPPHGGPAYDPSPAYAPSYDYEPPSRSHAAPPPPRAYRQPGAPRRRPRPAAPYDDGYEQPARYPAPTDYAPQGKPHGGGSGGTVTSYNRRGHVSGSYNRPNDYRSSVYGPSYAPQAHREPAYRPPAPPAPHGYGGPAHPPAPHRAPAYSGPRDYAYANPAPSYAVPPPSYGRGRDAYSQPDPRDEPHTRYGSYGPLRNDYSAESQQHSQDPNYDAAKDPVSQYAAYIPVREYAQKSHSDNRELSIYGYK